MELGAWSLKQVDNSSPTGIFNGKDSRGMCSFRAVPMQLIVLPYMDTEMAEVAGGCACLDPALRLQSIIFRQFGPNPALSWRVVLFASRPVKL